MKNPRCTMAEQDEESRLVIDVDPVEAVSFNYDNDRIPISYQKIGKKARTPRRGSAHAAGYDGLLHDKQRNIATTNSLHPIRLNY